MEGRASNHSFRRCSAIAAEEASHEHKRRKCSPAPPAAVDSFITRVKIVTVLSGCCAGEIDVVQDYNHLLGHCTRESPTTITWLSALPDHVISLILSFLPLQEAVQTSVLSKRWRHLWSAMPNLSLPRMASAEFIAKFLEHFKSPRIGVLEFGVLRVLGRFPTTQEIDSWLSLACSCHVEHMVVRPDFFYDRERRIYDFKLDLEVPPGFSTLKSLTLSYCMFETSVAKFLTSLEYLALEGMNLDGKTVEEFTSLCPMLGELELRDCNTMTSLRMRITNPKTSKLTITDSRNGLSTDRVLELYAPHLSQLVIVFNVSRIYQLQVPSLSTLKLAKQWRDVIYPDYHKAPMMSIFSGLDVKELYLSSMVMHYLGTKWVKEGVSLGTRMKVKRLHLHLEEISQEILGLVFFLNCCDGIETLIVDIENMYADVDRVSIDKHLRYLNLTTAVRSKNTNDPTENTDKKMRVCFNDDDKWSSLRFLLASQMPDLKCIMVNGFKRMLRVKKTYCSCDFGSKSGCGRLLVDKYELKLLKLLLHSPLRLERVSLTTKDVYFIEEVDDMGREMLAIRTDKWKNIHLKDKIDNRLEMSQWDKVLLSLLKGSASAKINVNHG